MQIWLIFPALHMFFAFLQAFAGEDGKGVFMASSVLLAAVYSGVILLLAKRKFRGEELGKTGFAAAAAAVFLTGLILRLWLGLTSEGFSSDLDTFKAWARITNEVGFGRIYREDIYLDYPPGYLYILTGLEKLRLLWGLESTSSAFTLMMKLPSILTDMACAGMLLVLARPRLGEKTALFLSAAYLFCPAVFLNSAQWGQADSFCTAILLGSVLLLYREHYFPSAILYGVAIACKPQMLIFAPLYLFFAVKQRKFWSLLLGIVSAVATLLLIATPFTQDFNYLWLVEKYRTTMDYYHYYSINAYNFWALIRWNWKSLPQGVAGSLLNLVGPVLATAFCAVLLGFSKRKDAVFACPVLLMSAMYLFSVKMHERYLFPALLFLLLSYLFVRDKRLLYAFSGMAFSHYLNVAYVLWQAQEKGSSYDPNTGLTVFLSLLQLLAFGYLLFVAWSVYIRGTVREGREPLERPLLDTRPIQSRFTRVDVCCVLAVTLLYGVVGFWHLGSTKTAVTSWTPAEGECVTLRTEEPCDVLYYLPGIAADSQHYSYRVGVNLKVESSTDGKFWNDCGELTDGSVFAWKQYRLASPGRYVRLTPLDGSVTVNEAALKLSGREAFAPVTVGTGGEALTDEQGVVPLYISYENSTYFDEIYHARTAYEHILQLEPYENTHPTLGKLIISVGIRIFGMNPFGWRFMGALFGVLMLPVLYHLLKQLFGKTLLCTAGVVLFAFDFMHFTQTRIATIDTYAVFFLLLMYDAMVLFLRKDLTVAPLKKLLPPLLACGVFTGLGIASKWTAAYGALGLAVLFFGKLAFTLLAEKREGGELRPLWKKCGLLCLWCCLFFLVIPFGIYFAAFLPLTTLPHNVERLWDTFVNYQTTMFNYHSQLKAEHYFASPWYEWPFDIRPIWYFASDACNAAGEYSTIAALGNPLLWIVSFLALIAAVRQLWHGIRRPAAVAAVGFLSVYLPWTLVPRLTFIYHYFTAVPFLIIALLAVFDRLQETPFLQKRLVFGEGEGALKLSVGSMALVLFVAVNLVLFAVYFPVISGAPTVKSYTDGLRLLPTWYF